MKQQGLDILLPDCKGTEFILKSWLILFYSEQQQPITVVHIQTQIKKMIINITQQVIIKQSNTIPALLTQLSWKWIEVLLLLTTIVIRKASTN